MRSDIPTSTHSAPPPPRNLPTALNLRGRGNVLSSMSIKNSTKVKPDECGAVQGNPEFTNLVDQHHYMYLDLQVVFCNTI